MVISTHVKCEIYAQIGLHKTGSDAVTEDIPHRENVPPPWPRFPLSRKQSHDVSGGRHGYKRIHPSLSSYEENNISGIIP